MIDINIKTLFVFFVLSLTFGCSSVPKKPEPYWLATANGFISKGIMLYEHQQYSASTTEFTHALNTYQRFDYVKGLADSYLNLAKSEIAQNNIDEAKKYLKNLKEIIEENEFLSMTVLMDITLSSIAFNIEKYDQVIEITEKYIDSDGVNVRGVSDNVFIALLTNRTKAAIVLNASSEKWVGIYEIKTNKNNIYQARLLRFKGQLKSRSNNVDMLNKYFSQALNLYREQANPKAVLSTLKEWGGALLYNEKNHDAVKRFETAYKVSISSGNEYEMRNILGYLLRLYTEAGDKENIKRVQQLISN
jgi:tetratricopeptide (TPR) repeat protein